jgi:hypothetical protein
MVKINEFHDMDIPQEILPKPDWNVGEDLLVFMRNDPMFYRKSLFPAVDDYKKTKDSKVIIRMVKQGLGDYCNKFNIPNPIEDLMNDGDIKEVAKQIILQDIKGKIE